MSEATSRFGDDPPSALPRGTRLGEFELLRVLGVGGFGIVYLAFDHALEREVAVKEYMPASLAGRTETLHVSLRSQSDADTFALGLKSFVNEARMLARFDHPSLLKVHRFWEGNGTAYMAMPVYRGQTFKDVRLAMEQPPDEAWLRALLTPLLGAIEKLHGEGVYHRDIAPDNIIIEADGRPVLLDFGAARRVISDKSQTLTAILKPAYAPIEQYAEAGSVKQGPWTDLYALGATVHFMLLGRPPAPATARAVHDDHAPLLGQQLLGCSDAFLNVVDWMLAPRPLDRPQSVAAVRDVLEGRAAAPVRRAAPAVPQGDWERTQAISAGPPPTTVVPRTKAPVPDDEGTVIRPPQRSTTLPPPVPVPPPPPPPPSPPPVPVAPPVAAPPAPAPRSKLVPALLGGVAVAALAGFFLWPKPAPAPTGAAAPAASAATAEAPPPASAPALTPVAAAPAAPLQAASAPAPVPTAAAKPSVVAEPKPQAKPGTGKAATASRPPETTEAQRPVVVSEPPKPAPAAVEVATPAPTPAPKPVEVAPVVPPPLAGPNERCGGRVVLALWLCIERECRKSELRQHPECVKWRNDQEQKANPTR